MDLIHWRRAEGNRFRQKVHLAVENARRGNNYNVKGHVGEQSEDGANRHSSIERIHWRRAEGEAAAPLYTRLLYWDSPPVSIASLCV